MIDAWPSPPWWLATSWTMAICEVSDSAWPKPRARMAIITALDGPPTMVSDRLARQPTPASTPPTATTAA